MKFSSPIILFCRIGRHGKMFLTVPSLSSIAEEKFIKKGEVLGPGTLLNLEPENAVFYVGGVPPGFKVGQIHILYSEIVQTNLAGLHLNTEMVHKIKLLI